MIYIMMSYYIIITPQVVAGIFSSIASIISVSVGPIITGKCDYVSYDDVIVMSLVIM